MSALSMIVGEAVRACYTLAMTEGKIIADFSVILSLTNNFFPNISLQMLIVKDMPPAEKRLRATTPLP